MTEKWNQALPLHESEPTTERVLAIDIDKIEPNPFQPLKEISGDKINEL